MEDDINKETMFKSETDAKFENNFIKKNIFFFHNMHVHQLNLILYHLT